LGRNSRPRANGSGGVAERLGTIPGVRARSGCRSTGRNRQNWNGAVSGRWPRWQHSKPPFSWPVIRRGVFGSIRSRAGEWLCPCSGPSRQGAGIARDVGLAAQVVRSRVGPASPSLERIPPMTNWMRGVCKTNGIHIQYRRTGGCKPPVVLLHGLTESGACWIPLARALEGEYDVAMPDARGTGIRAHRSMGIGTKSTQAMSLDSSKGSGSWLRFCWAGPLDGRHDCGRDRESKSNGLGHVKSFV
jgi:hypothetical protein